MRVVVIRYHEEDSPGFIGDAFRARGAELSVHLFPKEGPLPEVDGVDHVVVLGAVWSVYDEHPDRAWIADILAWLRRADEAGVPVLGICFGAQAMTAAFGGQVGPAPRKEVGWSVIETLDPDLVPHGPWLEFHGDQCFPPDHATVIARNEVGVQAFAIGRHLAVQFHPEAGGEQLRLWLDAGGREEAERAGTDPELFLAQTLAEEQSARVRADALVAAALLLANGASGAEQV